MQSLMQSLTRTRQAPPRHAYIRFRIHVRRTLLLAFMLKGMGCRGSADLVPPPAVELEPGALVPELPFVLQDGFKLRLRQLKGKLIVVYFCPALEQADCARETEGLRSRWNDMQERQHVTIVGVSRQDVASQRSVIAQQQLPFDLMSDLDGHMASAFGVPAGGPYPARGFFVGKDNRIKAVWRTANPEAHVAEILAAAHE